MSDSPIPTTVPHPAIRSLLASLRTGDPKIHNGLGLWPVFADCRPDPSYVTLVEALALPGFRITEVSEGGSVPSLRVANETPRHVLLFDGEELKGAKQNRILNTSRIVHLALFGGGGLGQAHAPAEPRLHHRRYRSYL